MVSLEASRGARTPFETGSSTERAAALLTLVAVSKDGVSMVGKTADGAIVRAWGYGKRYEAIAINTSNDQRGN